MMSNMNIKDKRLSSSQNRRSVSLRRLQSVCSNCYQRVLNRLAVVRAKVEREFGRKMAGYEQMLKAVINEAEAMAWQTPYPHLFFPELAEEKAAAAQRWVAHQSAVLRSGRAERPETVH